MGDMESDSQEDQENDIYSEVYEPAPWIGVDVKTKEENDKQSHESCSRILDKDCRFVVTVKKKGVAKTCKMDGTAILYVCRERLEFIHGKRRANKSCFSYTCIKDISLGKKVVFFQTGEGCPYGKGFVYCETFEGDKIYRMIKLRCLYLHAEQASCSKPKLRDLPDIPCLQPNRVKPEENSFKTFLKPSGIQPDDKSDTNASSQCQQQRLQQILPAKRDWRKDVNRFDVTVTDNATSKGFNIDGKHFLCIGTLGFAFEDINTSQLKSTFLFSSLAKFGKLKDMIFFVFDEESGHIHGTIYCETRDEDNIHDVLSAMVHLALKCPKDEQTNGLWCQPFRPLFPPPLPPRRPPPPSLPQMRNSNPRSTMIESESYSSEDEDIYKNRSQRKALSDLRRNTSEDQKIKEAFSNSDSDSSLDMCENFNKPNRKESKCDSARDLEFSSNMNKDDLYSDHRKDETKTRKDASETDVYCDYEYKPVVKEISVKDKETRNHVHGNSIQPDETYCQNKETSVQSNTALIKGIRGDGVKRTKEENQDAVTEEETVQKKFVAATSYTGDDVRVKHVPETRTKSHFTILPIPSGNKTKTTAEQDLKHTSVEMVSKQVDIYKPLIESTIRVDEILPHMSDLLDDVDSILALHKTSPREAVRSMLQQIADCEYIGKWRLLLDALNNAGYKYMANLLKGEFIGDSTTEKELHNRKRLLQIFAPEFVQILQPRELTDCLYGKAVISQHDKEEIECEEKNRGACAATFMLLNRIPRKVPNWYSEFLEALRVTGHSYVADDIDDIDVYSYPTRARDSNNTYQRTRKTRKQTNTETVCKNYITPEYKGTSDAIYEEYDRSDLSCEDDSITDTNSESFTQCKHLADENENSQLPKEYNDKTYCPGDEIKLPKEKMQEQVLPVCHPQSSANEDILSPEQGSYRPERNNVIATGKLKSRPTNYASERNDPGEFAHSHHNITRAPEQIVQSSFGDPPPYKSTEIGGEPHSESERTRSLNEAQKQSHFALVQNLQPVYIMPSTFSLSNGVPHVESVPQLPLNTTSTAYGIEPIISNAQFALPNSNYPIPQCQPNPCLQNFQCRPNSIFQNLPNLPNPNFQYSPNLPNSNFQNPSSVQNPNFQNPPNIPNPNFQPSLRLPTSKLQNPPSVSIQTTQRYPNVPDQNFQNPSRLPHPNAQSHPANLPNLNFQQRPTPPNPTVQYPPCMPNPNFQNPPNIPNPNFQPSINVPNPNSGNPPNIPNQNWQNYPNLQDQNVQNLASLQNRNFQNLQIFPNPNFQQHLSLQNPNFQNPPNMPNQNLHIPPNLLNPNLHHSPGLLFQSGSSLPNSSFQRSPSGFADQTFHMLQAPNVHMWVQNGSNESGYGSDTSNLGNCAGIQQPYPLY